MNILRYSLQHIYIYLASQNILGKVLTNDVSPSGGNPYSPTYMPYPVTYKLPNSINTDVKNGSGKSDDPDTFISPPRFRCCSSKFHKKLEMSSVFVDGTASPGGCNSVVVVSFLDSSSSSSSFLDDDCWMRNSESDPHQRTTTQSSIGRRTGRRIRVTRVEDGTNAVVRNDATRNCNKRIDW